MCDKDDFLRCCNSCLLNDLIHIFLFSVILKYLIKPESLDDVIKRTRKATGDDVLPWQKIPMKVTESLISLELTKCMFTEAAWKKI